MISAWHVLIRVNIIGLAPIADAVRPYIIF